MVNPYMMQQPQRTSGLAIAGFVCAFVCSPIGLILSILGNGEVKKSNGTVGGGGLALAGIVISAVNIVGSIFAMVFFVFLAKAASHDIDEINRRIEVEERRAHEAVKAAQAAQQTVEQTERDLADIDQQVEAAQTAVSAATNKDERAAASAKLTALQKRRAEVEARAAEAKAAADRAMRLEAPISDECMKNPLAKGC